LEGKPSRELSFRHLLSAFCNNCKKQKTKVSLVLTPFGGMRVHSHNITWRFKNQGKNEKNANISIENGIVEL
jgi:hypothetical protein